MKAVVAAFNQEALVGAFSVITNLWMELFEALVTNHVSRATCNATCVLQLGAVPEKTVLGVPLYGRAFLLKNTHNDKMGAPAQANSFAGLAFR